ncbi:hypothetical protein SDC9_147238 [bioreactor metagenome]|uniref:Uncharacterized protein n=1 Tax=bioreactor metagenome TaxID=1076179 RepID=A0A645EH12_9ZZZZ
MQLNAQARALFQRLDIDAGKRNAADLSVGHEPFEIAALLVVGHGELLDRALFNAKVLIHRLALPIRQIRAHGNALLTGVHGKRRR